MIKETNINDKFSHSVFISEPLNLGWIIEKLMRDIAFELVNKGIKVNIGPLENYAGEDIVFHSRYLYAKPLPQAKLNCLFVTHIDDYGKEIELRSLARGFDSIIFMSEQEAKFGRTLLPNTKNIIGINLPHCGGYIKRKRVAFFSAYYSDGRKNEGWLLEYFRSKSPNRRNDFILCLLGYDWEGFCKELAKLGVSYELYRYDRTMPGEYNEQTEILSRMSYLIYPGFDGGAMSAYDGLMAGLPLIISDTSYHRGISPETSLFTDKQGLFMELDKLALLTEAREHTLIERSLSNYVTTLVRHWHHILCPQLPHATDTPSQILERETVTNEYRAYYKNISPRRLISSFYRALTRLI